MSGSLERDAGYPAAADVTPGDVFAACFASQNGRDQTTQADRLTGERMRAQAERMGWELVRREVRRGG